MYKRVAQWATLSLYKLFYFIEPRKTKAASVKSGFVVMYCAGILQVF